MTVIKILPHHIREYFEACFLHRNPVEGNSWYNDVKFKQSGEATIRAVISNPLQDVQIVSGYDSFCKMCPRNPRGDNYTQPENRCTTYEGSDFVNELNTAKMLGIDGLINKSPITSEELFKKMEPVYKKIFAEKEDKKSKKISLRQYFRIRDNEILVESFYNL